MYNVRVVLLLLSNPPSFPFHYTKQYCTLHLIICYKHTHTHVHSYLVCIIYYIHIYQTWTQEKNSGGGGIIYFLFLIFRRFKHPNPPAFASDIYVGTSDIVRTSILFFIITLFGTLRISCRLLYTFFFFFRNIRFDVYTLTWIVSWFWSK
jgi:hypothetical protein